MKYPMSKVLVNLAVLALLLFSCQLPNRVNDKMAQMPAYTVEGTLVSVSPDANEDCRGKCPGYEYPRDQGVLRIDKIISVSNPDNVGGSGFAENSEVEVRFLYSARPARVVYVHSATAAGDPSKSRPVSSSPAFSRPIPIEAGQFIYTIETSTKGQPEIVLPGIEAGSRIQAVLYLETSTKGNLAIYTVIP